MTLRKALIYSMLSYPEHYLIHPDVLFVEATNRAATVFSEAEMLGELNGMEREKLCISQREYTILKWRLTGSGRAWIKGQ